ncbi:pre-rRNA 2'-O-ribose RNA methyltransferase FTSJ3 [Geodia barretti]|uniref:Pre-rRNA 2'-O-ribose RNA methyltransferase FTSJ3 n=1 Tax=Geodia barretti TaxID=519541 RepID=A0AA35RU69_GEOBA|nr:pre-rRNA 2'-O-ribose RNA methyltransferase FTSJ3 [Geodia barretti]
MAIASLLVQSKKKREDLIESGYNRWANDDQGLPDWFESDEARHYQKQIPISKEMVAEYRAQLRAINARPIKKVAEAKARKKQKAMRQLAKAKKRAEGITDTEDMSEREKMQHIKQIYKKAGVLGKKKPEVKYVVAKRGLAGKKAVRPAGVKGRYRQVDPRMKKDNRTMKMKAKAGSKQRGGKKKSR